MSGTEQFRIGEEVRINYPCAPYRTGYVREDDGGPKVQVAWNAQDGPKVGYRVVLYHGRRHIQWFPRERLVSLEQGGDLAKIHPVPDPYPEQCPDLLPASSGAPHLDALGNPYRCELGAGHGGGIHAGGGATWPAVVKGDGK